MLNIQHSPRVQPLLVIFMDAIDLLWLLLPVRLGIRLANPDIEEWGALGIPEATHPNVHSSVLCSIGPSTELFFSDVSENWLDLDVTIRRQYNKIRLYPLSGTRFIRFLWFTSKIISFEAGGTPTVNALTLKDKIKFRVLSYFFLLVLTLKSSAAKFLSFTSRSPARSFVFSACLIRPKIQAKLFAVNLLRSNFLSLQEFPYLEDQ